MERNQETLTNNPFLIHPYNVEENEDDILRQRLFFQRLPMPFNITAQTNRRTSSSNTNLRPAMRRNVRLLLEGNESENESGSEGREEYIDFRLYPLPLDWKEVEDENSIAFDILRVYGYIGLSLYTSFQNFPFLEPALIDNFLFRIVGAYKELTIVNQGDSSLKEFMRRLPNFSKIKDVIYKNLFNKKDLLSLKIIIDLYENYYKEYEHPFYHNLLRQLIPIAKLFYSSITNDDIHSLARIVSLDFKKYDIFTTFQTKKEYIHYYSKLKLEYKRIYADSKLKAFIR